MMGYLAQLGAGQSLQIQQRGDHTAIALISSAPGQQQQQQILISTGAWVVPPTLFKLPMGLVLRLEASQGQQFVHIQATGLHPVNSPPTLLGAEVLPLQQIEIPTPQPMVDLPSMPSMPSIPPMQPRQEVDQTGNMSMGGLMMGNMQMQMNPMVMRMGNMELRMDAVSTAPVVPTQPPQADSKATATTQQFCTQCGHPVKAGDRFCGACGHSLATE